MRPRCPAEADLVQARLAHRKLVVHDEEQGRRLAAGLTAEGWNASRLLVMVRGRPPEREVPAGLGAEVSRSEGAAALAAFRREQPFGWQDTGRGAADGDGRALSAGRRGA